MAYKLLGPTAQYLGVKTRELTEKMVNNVERIFQDATEKLGDKINEAGEVPPRVLRGIVNEGAFCEDEIAAGYLGGVLASSRGEAGRDDRGVVMNALITRLSVYQLRTHYIVHHVIKDLLDGTTVPLHDPVQHFRATAVMPYITYVVAMGFHCNEMSEMHADSDLRMRSVDAILEHTFFGLHKEGLIATFEYHYGKDASFSFAPSRLGIELFMWAYGYGGEPTYRFLDPALEFKQSDDVLLVPAYNPYHQIDPNGDAFEIPGYTLKHGGIGLTCRSPRSQPAEKMG